MVLFAASIRVGVVSSIFGVIVVVVGGGDWGASVVVFVGQL